jgi:hypothetical protein
MAYNRYIQAYHQPYNRHIILVSHCIFNKLTLFGCHNPAACCDKRSCLLSRPRGQTSSPPPHQSRKCAELMSDASMTPRPNVVHVKGKCGARLAKKRSKNMTEGARLAKKRSKNMTEGARLAKKRSKNMTEGARD